MTKRSQTGFKPREIIASGVFLSAIIFEAFNGFSELKLFDTYSALLKLDIVKINRRPLLHEILPALFATRNVGSKPTVDFFEKKTGKRVRQARIENQIRLNSFKAHSVEKYLPEFSPKLATSAITDGQ
jgi:hypothetical protein